MRYKRDKAKDVYDDSKKELLKLSNEIKAEWEAINKLTKDSET